MNEVSEKEKERQVISGIILADRHEQQGGGPGSAGNERWPERVDRLVRALEAARILDVVVVVHGCNGTVSIPEGRWPKVVLCGDAESVTGQETAANRGAISVRGTAGQSAGRPGTAGQPAGSQAESVQAAGDQMATGHMATGHMAASRAADDAGSCHALLKGYEALDKKDLHGVVVCPLAQRPLLSQRVLVELLQGFWKSGGKKIVVPGRDPSPGAPPQGAAIILGKTILEELQSAAPCNSIGELIARCPADELVKVALAPPGEPEESGRVSTW